MADQSGRFERLKGGVGNLHEHEGADRVSDAHTDHLAAFQFFQKTAGIGRVFAHVSACPLSRVRHSGVFPGL